MKEDHRSNRRNFLQLRKEILKKFRRVRDSSPSPLLYLCYTGPALYQLRRRSCRSKFPLSRFPYRTPRSRCSLVPIIPLSLTSFVSSSRGGPAWPLPRVPLSALSLGNSWESLWSNLRSGSIFVSL